jgi:hypothetical protein
MSSRPGVAGQRPGEAWSGRARHGGARQGYFDDFNFMRLRRIPSYGPAGLGTVGRGAARLGKVRLGLAGPGKAGIFCQFAARCGRARQGTAVQGKAGKESGT